MQTSEAMVRPVGMKTQAKRPAFPIVAVLRCRGVGEIGKARWWVGRYVELEVYQVKANEGVKAS